MNNRPIPAGTIVVIRAKRTPEGEGLSYPRMLAMLSEPCETEGWDVIDVHSESGEEMSVYSFSVEGPAMAPPEDPPADTRSMRDLANEAIRVQDACNLSGVAHAFSRMLPRLRAVLAEKLGTGPSTQEVNTHPITQAWVDKLASLAGVQAWSGTGHDNARKAHDECLDLAANARY